jgi:hypothetical protein
VQAGLRHGLLQARAPEGPVRRLLNAATASTGAGRTSSARAVARASNHARHSHPRGNISQVAPLVGGVSAPEHPWLLRIEQVALCVVS